MSKGLPKPCLVTATGPFGGHDRPEGKDAAIQAVIANGPDWLTIRTRPRRKASVTSAQKLQRLNYSDCDCLWKYRDQLQASQWEKYISEKNLKKIHNLDSYRLFMKGCLDWDFVDYFTHYLWAVWKLDAITKTPTGYRVQVHMASLLDEAAPELRLEPYSPVNRIL